MGPETGPQTDADRQAIANFQANSQALNLTQPKLLQKIKEIEIPLSWAYGRDGFLTAVDGRRWWTACSVPLLAGREMFKKLDLAGTVGCFVCPSHAGQLRAGFERLQSKQAFLAIVPDPLSLAVTLHCDDFSEEISSGRLLFAGGWDWIDQLATLLKDHPGLPLPQNFVRTALVDDADLDRFTVEAQSVISAETTRRAEAINLIRNSAERQSRPGQKILVIAPTHFRLGDFSGQVLNNLCNQTDCDAFVAINPDDPQSASPMAVASAAQNAGALVMANSFRENFPNIVSNKTAWITWLTTTPDAIASPSPSAPNDALLLADPAWQSAALAKGWSKDRIDIAGWPANLSLDLLPSTSGGANLGLFVDTQTLEIPKKQKDLSSFALLWEMIETELRADPSILGTDADKFLDRCITKLAIPSEGLDRHLFIDQLIFPAYHQSLARQLIAARLPVALFGKGWMDIEEFRPHANGPIASTADFEQAISQCALLLDPNPMTKQSFPLRSLPIAILQPAGLNPTAPKNSARTQMQNAIPRKTQTISPLSRGRIAGLIPGFRWPAMDHELIAISSD
jgi:hypothetical protein